MIRILIAAILGALIYFAWGMASWMAFHLHDDTMKSLENEEEMVAALKNQDMEPGWYTIPGMDGTMEEVMEKHRQGPVVSIIYSEGGEPMDLMVMVNGFLLNLAAAFIAAILLSSATCCQNYFARVGFVLGLGLFSSIVSHLAYWNWMAFPLHHSLIMCLDLVVGWTLVGMFMATIIRPPKHSSS